jgi:Fe-S cluster biogenesis protein NfuA
VSDDAALGAALDEVRALVQADGGDLRLAGVDGDVVALELVLEGAECAECVMPREFLEQVALDVLRRGGATVGGVRIADPREA